MQGRIFAIMTIILSCSLYAWAGSKQASLTKAEENGKGMFQQRCSICHTPPRTGDKTYGPMLNADSVRDEAVARAIIMKGTPRMPGFQYGLRPKEIDNIIAYLKTVKDTAGQQQK